MALKGNLRDPRGVRCPAPGLLGVSARPVTSCYTCARAALWKLASVYAQRSCKCVRGCDPLKGTPRLTGRDPVELVPSRGPADTWGHAIGSDGRRAAGRLEVAQACHDEAALGRCANGDVTTRTAHDPGRSLV